jgi:hypothetical protein
MGARTLAPLLIVTGVLAQPTVVSAQVDSPTTDLRAERDDGFDLGWFGLLGLAGLLGLRGRGRKIADDVGITRRSA